jgi:hypothetical protein
MVVDSNGKNLLCGFLSDNMLVEVGLKLGGSLNVKRGLGLGLGALLEFMDRR